MQYFETNDSLIVKTPTGRLRSIHKKNRFFDKVKACLKKGRFDKVLEWMDLVTRIKNQSRGKFEMKGNKIFYKGHLMPTGLSRRVLQFSDSNLPFTPLMRFWANCVKNKNPRSREHVFAFLQHNGIPLTKDGCFIAYKRVTEKFKDHHTGRMDNSIGTVVKMDRKKVDPNPKNVCSRGLHVAAFHYAKSMYTNGHLVAVKVNPRDVVCVPNDYDGEKMRVCRYEVMEKLAGPRVAAIYPEFKEGAVVRVLPNLDNVDDLFVGTVIEVIEEEFETPKYVIKRVDNDKEVTFEQHHVMYLDQDDDGNPLPLKDFCPECQEEICICDDLEDEDEYDEDYDDEDYEEEEEDD